MSDTDTNKNYAYWMAELERPNSQPRDTTERLDGFWRLIGAKTKPDYPVAFWGETMKVGRKAEFPIASDEGHDFMVAQFPKCSAVPEEEYRKAIDTGFWSDGKPARAVSEAERHGLDLGDGATGGNNPPPFELLTQQIGELVKRAKSLNVDNQDAANEAKTLGDKLKILTDKADNERATEKEPHDQASKDVQAKWMSVITPGREARAALTNAVQTFLRAKQAELDAEAAAETERRRLAAQQEAEAEGKPIDAVFVAPVVADKATAGAAFGRSTSAKKTKRAVIVDLEKLIGAIKDSSDFLEFCQKKADASLRAKIVLPGVDYVDGK